MLLVSILWYITRVATVCGFPPVKVPAGVRGGFCNSSCEAGAVEPVKVALCILFKWCFVLLESVYP